MENDNISTRQLIVLSFTGLLAPMVRILPRSPAIIAGKAAWLSPLLAVAVSFIYSLFIRFILKSRNDGEGLTEIFTRCLGGFFGKTLAVIWGLWLLIYSGFIVRSAAERLLSAVYEEGSYTPFIIVLVIGALIAAAGKTGSLMRTAEVFAPIILSVFVAIIIFSTSEIRSEFLLPVTYQDIGKAALGAIPVVDIVGANVLFLFLAGNIKKKPKDGKSVTRWMLLEMFIAFGIMLVSVGGCSANLASKFQNAFFVVIRNITIFGVVERMEALIVTIWVITDFLLLAALLMIVSEIVKAVFGIKKRKTAVYPAAALSAVGAFIISKDAFGVNTWSQLVVPMVNMALSFGLTPIAVLIGKIRKKL